MFLGLRTTIHPAPDLDAAKAWWTEVLGTEPYFDEPFYVGFSVGGFELGLDPDAPSDRGPVTYWGVAEADAALAQLEAAGATVDVPVKEVGGGIRVAILREPAGLPFGIIENPNFEAAPVASDGPGR